MSESVPMPREGTQRQSTLGVLGIALGFLLIVGALGALMGLRRSNDALDAEELLAQRFASVEELPFDLRPTGASRDPMERVVVRFESGPEESGPEEGGAEEGGALEGDIRVGESGESPHRAALVWYSRKDAEKVLRRLFTSLHFESGRKGSGGGHGGHGDDEDETPDPKLQDAGNLTWAGYAAPYIRLREFEGQGDEVVFRETVRVNLTVGPWCCVLFVRWPDGEVGGRTATQEILRALHPVRVN